MGSRERRARRGRPSILEEGWVETDPTGKGNDLTWTVTSPAGRFLALVGVGISQREACIQAGVNRATITTLLASAAPWMPPDPTPAQIRTIADDQARRMVAFAVAVDRAKGNPKAIGLTSIAAAAQAGDWRAGDRLLVRLYPEEFRDRLAVTGADGGPVVVDAPAVAEKVGQMLKNLVAAREDEDAEKVNVAAVEGPEVNLERAPVEFPVGAEGATPGAAT